MKLIILSLLIVICTSASLALPKGEIADSNIVNVNKNTTVRARNKSVVNTGIQARGAIIKHSTLTNRFTGTVNADNHSNVNVGIKADGAKIENSHISVDTRGKIQANNATVKTGVDLSGAKNATIKTKFTGKINASDAIVKAGSVEGNIRNKKITTNVTDNINAQGRGVKIGTVSVGGGRPAKYLGKRGLGVGPRRSGASIGNVEIDSNMVRKVDTEVGSGNFIKGLKTRHMAKFYADQGGVDPSGTKYVFVSKKTKERAKKRGGSVGNTKVNNASGIRKVNTFVE